MLRRNYSPKKSNGDRRNEICFKCKLCQFSGAAAFEAIREVVEVHNSSKALLENKQIGRRKVFGSQCENSFSHQSLSPCLAQELKLFYCKKKTLKTFQSMTEIFSLEISSCIELSVTWRIPGIKLFLFPSAFRDRLFYFDENFRLFLFSNSCDTRDVSGELSFSFHQSFWNIFGATRMLLVISVFECRKNIARKINFFAAWEKHLQCC